MRIVQVESPYAGDIEANVAYARAAMADCLRRGEAPFASHLLYTQPGVLRDDDPAERRLGIEAGLAFLRVADASVVYVDLGFSGGMRAGIERAYRAGTPVEARSLRGIEDPQAAMLAEMPRCQSCGAPVASGSFCGDQCATRERELVEGARTR